MSHALAARRRGFTLIELLVVVAIIALLISILLPSLSKARETARMVGCLSIHKQMGVANIMYADANDQIYVPFTAPSSAGITIGGGFWGAIIPFRQNLGLPITAGVAGQPGTGQTAVSGLICPSKPGDFIDKGEWYRTFAFSQMGSPGLREGSVREDNQISRAKVRNPSGKVMGMDAVNWYLHGTAEADASLRWDIYGDTHSGVPSGTHVAYRHLEQVNTLFHDGHAAAMTKDEAWKPALAYRITLYDPYKN